ncbi:hypothetical protein TNCV_826211 [Trichonephila clavipes]|nr:hypothetical protein TNCV_826211 [Trichonephila clavipes]
MDGSENRCSGLLKKESNKRVFLPEEPGNTKERMADRWSSKGLRYRRDTQRQYNIKHVNFNLFATGFYMIVSVRIVESYIR